MRLGHFERLRPVCPACRNSGDTPLALEIEACEADDVTSGVLRCEACGQAYPIISGVPILMPDLAAWLAANLHLMLQADISGAAAEAVVGALAGPDSAFNLVRQQQSTYGHAHYGDLAGGVTVAEEEGGVVSLLRHGLTAGALAEGPVLDLGCAVGGTSFALCDLADDLVLGIDVNWPLLKIARQAAETGWVRYSLRIQGVTYDRRMGRLACARPERADFWVADALALPFAAATFGQVVGLNVIDCVPDPARMVREMARVLASRGRYLLATPFDWASHATPPHLWITDPQHLSQLLQNNGLSTTPITEAYWRLQLHALSTMTYRVKFFTGEQGANLL